MKRTGIIFCVVSTFVLLSACGNGDAPTATQAPSENAPTESVNIREMFGTTLINAARDGELELVREMIAAGADVNETNMYSETVLMKAAESGNAELVELLISEGADLYAEDLYGYTVVVHAEDHPQVQEIVRAAMQANPE